MFWSTAVQMRGATFWELLLNLIHGSAPDLQMMVEAARLSRDILRQPAFDRWRRAPIHPQREDLDDQALAAFVRAKAETIYHPAGTCRMGNDARAVVDPQLRVNGLNGLRVVDASVMPTLVTGNTNAPTMMIAERAADLILARSAQLAPVA